MYEIIFFSTSQIESILLNAWNTSMSFFCNPILDGMAKDTIKMYWFWTSLVHLLK